MEEKHTHTHSHHKHKKWRFGHSHNTGMLSIDIYAYASKIRDWNPAFKVWFAMSLIIYSIAANSIYVSLLIVFAMSWLTVGKGKLDLSRYLTLMSLPLVFIVMSSIALAVNIAPEPVDYYGISLGFCYLYVTPESLYTTARVVLRAFGAVSAMYMMSLSTPLTEIVSVLRKAKVPALMTELMNMIYRFIFILLDSQTRMTIAAKSRLGYCDLKTSYFSFGRTLSNLLVVSLRKANAYYDAMESRCYDGELNFLEEEKPVKKEQILWAILFLIGLTIVWVYVK